MSILNEIRNMKMSVHVAAQKKQELDRKNSGKHLSNSIKSAVERKKEINTYSSRGTALYHWMSPVMASVFFACAGAFMCFSLYQNVFASAHGCTSSYLKAGDFKRAENFVNSFLTGNFSEKDYYNPEKAEILMKNAAGLLPSFNGIPASIAFVCDNDDNKNVVLKATCPKGTESAIIYLVLSGTKFHVSGIEIEKCYTDEISSL